MDTQTLNKLPPCYLFTKKSVYFCSPNRLVCLFDDTREKLDEVIEKETFLKDTFDDVNQIDLMDAKDFSENYDTIVTLLKLSRNLEEISVSYYDWYKAYFVEKDYHKANNIDIKILVKTTNVHMKFYNNGDNTFLLSEVDSSAINNIGYIPTSNPMKPFRFTSLPESVVSILQTNRDYFIKQTIIPTQQILYKLNTFCFVVDKSNQVRILTGGKQPHKLRILGRERKIYKDGRKSFIIYNKQQLSLPEARKLDKQMMKQKAMGSKRPVSKRSRV